MAATDIALMAHLMRRAGFGATYEELENFAVKGYEAVVDELLSPMEQPDLEMDLLERYFIDWKEMNALEVNQAYLEQQIGTTICAANPDAFTRKIFCHRQAYAARGSGNDCNTSLYFDRHVLPLFGMSCIHRVICCVILISCAK